MERARSLGVSIPTAWYFLMHTVQIFEMHCWTLQNISQCHFKWLWCSVHTFAVVLFVFWLHKMAAIVLWAPLQNFPPFHFCCNKKHIISTYLKSLCIFRKTQEGVFECTSSITKLHTFRGCCYPPILEFYLKKWEKINLAKKSVLGKVFIEVRSITIERSYTEF